jgi:hypothetical protein
MASVSAPSDMLVTVKSREIQRALSAAMRHEEPRARRHFLAAAHLELVLADDYAQSGEDELAFRSGLSAASCFWRGGEPATARLKMAELATRFPGHQDEIDAVVADLAHVSDPN